jgi:hypothetical protein
VVEPIEQSDETKLQVFVVGSPKTQCFSFRAFRDTGSALGSQGSGDSLPDGV